MTTILPVLPEHLNKSLSNKLNLCGCFNFNLNDKSLDSYNTGGSGQKPGIMSPLPLPFSSAPCSDGDVVSSTRAPRWRKCLTQFMVRFHIYPTMLMTTRMMLLKARQTT